MLFCECDLYFINAEEEEEERGVNGNSDAVCGAWGSVTREEGYAGETRTTSHTNIDYNFKTVLLTIRYFLRVLLINTFGFEPFANKILINKHGE